MQPQMKESQCHLLSELPSLGQAADVVKQFGGKATSLGFLKKDFNVPDGICVSVDAMRKHVSASLQPDDLKWLAGQFSSSSRIDFQRGIQILTQGQLTIKGEDEAAHDRMVSIRSLITKHPLDDSIVEELRSFFETHNIEDGFAVRSSGTLEDSENTSFAGLMETVLNVKTFESLQDAIRFCWSFVFNEQADIYSKPTPGYSPVDGFIPQGLGLLIQKQIESRSSGVAFLHEGCAVIDACHGQGHGLVSGQVVSERITVASDGTVTTFPLVANQDKMWVLDTASGLKTVPVPKTSKPTLTEEESKLVGLLCIDVSKVKGSPQDIEFSVDFDGELWLLQSRPITRTLPSDAHENLVWRAPTNDSVWHLDPVHHPKPCSRLFQSFFADAITRGFKCTCKRYGLLIETPLQVQFVNDMLYQRFVPLTDDPINDQADFTRLCNSNSVYMDRISTAAKIFEEKPWLHVLQKWENKTKPQILATHRSLQEKPLHLMDNNELVAHYEACLKHTIKTIYLHHKLQGDVLTPVGDFLVFTNEITGTPFDELVMILHSCLSSSAHEQGIQKESRTLIRNAFSLPQAQVVREKVLKSEELSEASSKLQSLIEDSVVGSAMKSFLFDYGEGIRITSGYDVCEPTALEIPNLVLDKIRSILSPSQNKTACLPLETIMSKIPSQHLNKFNELLEDASRLYHFRDEKALVLDSWSTGLLHLAILELGNRLMNRGWILLPSHLFHASTEELDILFEDFIGISDSIKARVTPKDLETRAHAITRNNGRFAPPVLPTSKQMLPPLPLDWFPNDAKRVEASIRAMVKTILIPQQLPEEMNSKIIHGISACQGIYHGPARVISTGEDLKRVRPGDVVIAPCTSSSFVALMSTIGALVTDFGGVLSHAAILARENELPCVVSCINVTTRIEDGMMVTVDGDRGIVTID